MKAVVLLSGALFLFGSSPCFAENESPQYSKDIEIKTMLPGLEEALPVLVAVPDDFISASKTSTTDLQKGVFWGKKETLDKYFAGEIPLESCIIAVKKSNTVIQDGPHDFHADMAIRRELRLLGRSKLSIKKMSWGKYPLLVIEAVSHGGNHYFLAWLGLNEPSGKTLMFTFLCPDFSNRPSDKELAIWYHFLWNSQEVNQKKEPALEQ